MYITDLKTVKDISNGWERIEENDGGFSFFRMTEKETEAFKSKGKTERPPMGAGVRFAFRSDTRSFAFRFKVTERTFIEGAFDFYVDGVMVMNFKFNNDLTEGRFSYNRIEAGEHLIELYFPWSLATVISDIEIDDGAKIIPVRRKRNMLCYGDSITQGFLSEHPSLTYTERIGRMIDADIINKAVGGDVFFPELIGEKSRVAPDIITVAYGTNDWTLNTASDMKAHCRDFFGRLTYLYPNTKILAVTPIWRQDLAFPHKYDEPFDTIYDTIKNEASSFENVYVVNGMTLTPHQVEFYYERYLHPNDIGFGCYAEGLLPHIMKIL